MEQNQEKISLKAAMKLLGGSGRRLACSGLAGSEKAYFVAEVYQREPRPLCVVLNSTSQAEAFIQDLRFFLEKNDATILYFPPYNVFSGRFLSYQNEAAAQRIQTLYRLVENRSAPIVVTTVGGLLMRLIPKRKLCDYAELVMADEEIDRGDLIEKLVSGGYSRSALVEEPGEFSIRGGIIDVFTPFYPEPLRMELEGDRIDSLRFFSPVSQRTTQRVSEAIIIPAGEAVVEKVRLPQIINRIREQAAEQELPVTPIRAFIKTVKNDQTWPGIEHMLPLIYAEPGILFDYLAAETLFVLSEPQALEAAAAELKAQAEESYQTALEEARPAVEPGRLYLSWPEAYENFLKNRVVAIKMLPVSGPGSDDEKQIDFSVNDNSDLELALKQHKGQERPLSPLAEGITTYLGSGWRTLLVCKNRTQGERLISLLKPYQIRPVVIEKFTDMTIEKGRVYICRGQLSSGFAWPDQALAVITETEIFGAIQHRRMRTSKRILAQRLPLEALKKGDFVVHSEHGIGLYQGLAKLKLDGSENDFILIQYKDNDKLYLPVDRLSMVQKYNGVENVAPMLDKMGSTSWARAKERVKKSVEKIAGELLKIYAERKVSKGFAFSEPDGYFQDFEAGFPYEETGDQASTIQDVLADMRKPTPMDRLVCGDVGYGKTEVALRAAFVAVYNGKQVAVLVPTTVLAEQHFATFSNRFQNYPVNIACLSRFRPQSRQRAIVSDLKDGKIDIVIGTHRLLQKDIFFKELGLVVLDEEQRFGVRHKEKLKKIRRTVDILALTATPIPRTLYMSLTGIRDISIISTPPEHRHPIITYVSEFDAAVIRQAIRNELDRGGQLFFVNNNIKRIQSMADYLQRLVPELRLDIAHGRMEEDELENVMLKFVKREIDMLVCTTIIESGLDIPSANTILVNRADKFGLAQMYQLRGRVGRADEQAFAYLFIPRQSVLGNDAQKRLRILMEHSDLGSGFQIAMSDLKIRGGGTILGPSQSGHIAAVGYEMFLKLMESAVSELKGEAVYEDLEPEINIQMSAFIPEAYIADIDQRLAAYRRLAKMADPGEVDDFRRELEDRYGSLPAETSNLFLKIGLKVLAIRAGVKKLDLNGRRLSLSFSEVHQQNPQGIVAVIHNHKNYFQFTPQHVLKATLAKKAPGGTILEIKNILKEITQHVNP